MLMFQPRLSNMGRESSKRQNQDDAGPSNKKLCTEKVVESAKKQTCTLCRDHLLANGEKDREVPKKAGHKKKCPYEKKNIPIYKCPPNCEICENRYNARSVIAKAVKTGRNLTIDIPNDPVNKICKGLQKLLEDTVRALLKRNPQGGLQIEQGLRTGKITYFNIFEYIHHRIYYFISVGIARIW